MDTLENLSIQLGRALQKRGYQLTLAESCTGGMACAAITEIAGSSDWFDCGFITYSNASKQEMLGVSPSTLEQFGAVSEETAREMVVGALNASKAQVAASITGIAGPGGETVAKPVGTVCFAWGTKDGQSNSTTKYFTGNRLEIRQQAVIFIFTALLNQLASN
jgi:nicotinamide-nucleotide amidase